MGLSPASLSETRNPADPSLSLSLHDVAPPRIVPKMCTAVRQRNLGGLLQSRAQSLSGHLDGQRDPLATADAHRDDTPLEAVSTHRMEKTGR
jgi:hypothetical protein